MKSTRFVSFGTSSSIAFCQIFIDEFIYLDFFGEAPSTRPTTGAVDTHADNILTRSKGKVQQLTLKTFSSRVER